MTLPSVKGRTSCGETNLWNVSSSLGNWNRSEKLKPESICLMWDKNNMWFFTIRQTFFNWVLYENMMKWLIYTDFGYLRWEFEHGCAHDERGRMMLGSQSQSVCAINRPQTSVSQNRLCADDDLKIIQHTHTYKINYLPDFKNEKPVSFYLINSWHHRKDGSVWYDCRLNVLFGQTRGHFVSLMDQRTLQSSLKVQRLSSFLFRHTFRPLSITNIILTSKACLNHSKLSILQLCDVLVKLFNTKKVQTWQKGAHSATITWNLRFRAASLRKASTVLERPTVMMTSFEWMCSRACMEMLSVVPSKETKPTNTHESKIQTSLLKAIVCLDSHPVRSAVHWWLRWHWLWDGRSVVWSYPRWILQTSGACATTPADPPLHCCLSTWETIQDLHSERKTTGGFI